MGRSLRVAFEGSLTPPGCLSYWRMAGRVPSRDLKGGYDSLMPRIPDELLKAVVFQFKTADEARRRLPIGGTSFLVGRRFSGEKPEDPEARYIPYLVSNKHVVHAGAASVAAINRVGGLAPDIFEFDPSDWHAHPKGDDLAAVCLKHSHINESIHDLTFVGDDLFITQDSIKRWNIGIGDEVFMLGRFLNHQGAVDNRPAARFGSISMMLEPIEHEGFMQDSFAVEMRSRTGFSGSPVTFYRTPSTVILKKVEPDNKVWGLLGVNYGYILDRTDGEIENTWLNGVIPAWKIMELLDVPALQQPWKNAVIDEQIRKVKFVASNADSGVVSDRSKSEQDVRRDNILKSALSTSHKKSK